MKKWLPLMGVIVSAVVIYFMLRDEPEKGFHAREFGSLPVLMNGRIQPLDSVARNALLQIRTRQSVFIPDGGGANGFSKGRNLTATEWLMGVLMKPEMANEQKVFRIDNPELLALLKLPEKEKYFSFNELLLNYEEIRRQSQRVEEEKREAQGRTAFEKQVVKLLDSMTLYQRLTVTIRPPESSDFAEELEECENNITKIRKGEADSNTFARLSSLFSRYGMMADYGCFRAIPPGDGQNNWETAGSSLTNLVRAEAVDSALKKYAEMTSAYSQNRPEDFNAALAYYNRLLERRGAAGRTRARYEFFYNRIAPFYKALVIYAMGFVFACVSWFNFSTWLRRLALYLVLVAWCIHSFGMIFRMVLEGRPPVTNLYSSAVFIGWGAAALGMVLEKIYRDGIGSAIASTAGFLTLIIAHNLALGGDTMEMLRAVLDTNFWLATHVTVVTLGYSATFVAGFLAIIYVIRGLFTRSLSVTTSRSLGRMVYGIVCFATLFSFTGTILGGIWADQSWGRFWGWDPKENGALLIVLWNAVILHARWGGMVRERGLMLMAITGNIVTGWSWFGVNMLGIGLHSYGFTDQAFWWLLAFAVSQIVLIALGLTPLHRWRSFQPDQKISMVGRSSANSGKLLTNTV